MSYYQIKYKLLRNFADTNMITVLNLVEEMYKNTRSKRWCKQRIEELRCVHFLVQERSTICFEKTHVISGKKH